FERRTECIGSRPHERRVKRSIDGEATSSSNTGLLRDPGEVVEIGGTGADNDLAAAVQVCDPCAIARGMADGSCLLFIGPEECEQRTGFGLLRSRGRIGSVDGEAEAIGEVDRSRREQCRDLPKRMARMSDGL